MPWRIVVALHEDQILGPGITLSVCVRGPVCRKVRARVGSVYARPYPPIDIPATNLVQLLRV